MKMFTEEQVKELLKQQRINCENAWAASYLDCNLLNAPEPELPEVEEQRPYGWVHKVTRHFISNNELRENYITSIGYDAVFLNRQVD